MTEIKLNRLLSGPRSWYIDRCKPVRSDRGFQCFLDKYSDIIHRIQNKNRVLDVGCAGGYFYPE